MSTATDRAVEDLVDQLEWLGLPNVAARVAAALATGMHAYAEILGRDDQAWLAFVEGCRCLRGLPGAVRDDDVTLGALAHAVVDGPALLARVRLVRHPVDGLPH